MTSDYMLYDYIIFIFEGWGSDSSVTVRMRDGVAILHSQCIEYKRCHHTTKLLYISSRGLCNIQIPLVNIFRAVSFFLPKPIQSHQSLLFLSKLYLMYFCHISIYFWRILTCFNDVFCPLISVKKLQWSDFDVFLTYCNTLERVYSLGQLCDLQAVIGNSYRNCLQIAKKCFLNRRTIRYARFRFPDSPQQRLWNRLTHGLLLFKTSYV